MKTVKNYQLLNINVLILTKNMHSQKINPQKNPQQPKSLLEAIEDEVYMCCKKYFTAWKTTHKMMHHQISITSNILSFPVTPKALPANLYSHTCIRIRNNYFLYSQTFSSWHEFCWFNSIQLWLIQICQCESEKRRNS